MRVLMVCDSFFKHVVRIVEGLAAEDVEVTILARGQTFEFGHDSGARDAFVARAERAGAVVHELPFKYRDPAGLARLASSGVKVHFWSPDVIHAQDGADVRALALVGRRPVLLTVHDPIPHPDAPEPTTRAGRLAGRAAYLGWRKRATVAVVHGQRLRTELREAGGPSRIEVVPHGISIAAKPAPLPAEPTVGFFGRLEEYKGLSVFDEAIRQVWRSRPDVRVIVVGHGSHPSRLFDPRAEIVDRYVSEAEIRAYMGRMSIIVLPYLQASQSGPGTTAAGMGIPALVTDVGGLPEIALDRSYVVPPSDAAALANALLAHIDDGNAVRQRVYSEIASPRSWHRVAKRYLELYKALSSDAHRAARNGSASRSG